MNQQANILHMDEERWLQTCKPIPNPRRPTGFDYGYGNCLFTEVDLLVQLEKYPEQVYFVWTVYAPQNGGMPYIYQGKTNSQVPTLGYFITEKIPEIPINYPILVG